MDNHEFDLISDSNCPGPQPEYPNTNKQLLGPLPLEIDSNMSFEVVILIQSLMREVCFHDP